LLKFILYVTLIVVLILNVINSHSTSFLSRDVGGCKGADAKECEAGAGCKWSGKACYNPTAIKDIATKAWHDLQEMQKKNV